MNTQTIFLIYMTGTFLLTVAALSLFLFMYKSARKKNNELLAQQHVRKLSDDQLEEHGRTLLEVATKLHDNVLQTSVLLRMRLHAIQRDLQSLGFETSKIDQALDDNSRLDDEIQCLLKSLNTEYFLSEDLEGLLRKEISSHKSSIIFFELNRNGEITLRPYQRILTFRIAREAIHNSLKHSLGDKITITLNQNDEGFQLRVSDNGIGISPEKIYGGKTHGIENMKLRSRCLDGQLDIGSESGSGTTVTFKIERRHIVDPEFINVNS